MASGQAAASLGRIVLLILHQPGRFRLYPSRQNQGPTERFDRQQLPYHAHCFRMATDDPVWRHSVNQVRRFGRRESVHHLTAPSDQNGPSRAGPLLKGKELSKGRRTILVRATNGASLFRRLVGRVNAQFLRRLDGFWPTI
jgi:hypothetical protein